MTYFLWPKIPTFTYIGTSGDTSLQTINSTSFGVNVTVIIEIQNDNRIDLNLQNIRAVGYYYMLPNVPVAQLEYPNIRIPRRATTTLEIPIEVVYNMDNDPGGASGVDLVRSCGLLGASLAKNLIGSYNIFVEAALLRFRDPVVIKIQQELDIACPFNITTLPDVLNTVLPASLVDILMKAADNVGSIVGTVNGVTGSITNTENTINDFGNGNIAGGLTGIGNTVDSVTDTVNNLGNAIGGVFG